MSNLPNLSGKTILQIIPELDAGGAERTVIEIAEAVVKAGGRALVASKGGRLELELEGRGGDLVKMDVASKNPLILYKNVKVLADLITTEHVSLVHARSRAPAWSALGATTRTETPFVTTYHGAYASTFAPKRAYNSIMTRGDIVIANSAWTGQHILETHEVDENKIVVIPRGVDFGEFDPDTVSEDRISKMRQHWGIGTDNERLLLVLPARFTAWKGQALALNALAALSAEEQKELVLVLVGDAQGRHGYLSQLQNMIAHHALVESTRLASHCEDMPAALAAADIVLSPSLKPEAFGRAAIEAAAMSRPVIAAAHGGALETVIDGVTGAQFEPGNAIALAGAIRSLVSLGQETRQSMGTAGRHHTLQNFSKEGLQAATLSVYSALIAQGKLKRE